MCVFVCVCFERVRSVYVHANVYLNVHAIQAALPEWEICVHMCLFHVWQRANIYIHMNVCVFIFYLCVVQIFDYGRLWVTLCIYIFLKDMCLTVCCFLDLYVYFTFLWIYGYIQISMRCGMCRSDCKCACACYYACANPQRGQSSRLVPTVGSLTLRVCDWGLPDEMLPDWL